MTKLKAAIKEPPTLPVMKLVAQLSRLQPICLPVMILVAVVMGVAVAINKGVIPI
jgi:hypothetical protein